MRLSLVTELPLWFSLFCLLTGGLYAWLLYRKSSLADEVPAWQLRLMTAFRFLLVSVLTFLLLGPMVKHIHREVEKPILVLAYDHSYSLINTKDSAQIKQQLTSGYDRLKQELSGQFDVRTYAFGDNVRENPDFQFTDKETDFSALYEALDIAFVNRNVGAIVMATDGIYNAGSNPVYGPSRLKVPFYTIGFGDTTVRKDLMISAVRHNKMAFLGNAFPLEVLVDARQCQGAQATLTVAEDSVTKFTRQLSVSGNTYHISVPVLLDAAKKGIHRYSISVSSLTGEVTYTNNSTEVFIEVVENKQKVLVLANAPHPDVAALKDAIESSPNYEVKVAMANDFDGRLSEYNLVILHNVPAMGGAFEVEKLKNGDFSRWYILGGATAINAFNDLGTGVKVAQANGSVTDVQALVQRDFSLFTQQDALEREIPSWPPLKVPFGMYQESGAVSTLLNQRVGTVDAHQPLLWFFEQSGIKTAVLAGEGLWKWHLSDFNRNGNHDLSNELITHIVQYLCVRENRSPFRVQVRTSFRENEALEFNAELHNESDQLVNAPDVRLTITNRSGRQFPFTFSRTEKAYYLNAGTFPVGSYHYKAETKLGEKLYAAEGEFSISALQVERANTIADFQLLSTLSERTGGAFYRPAEIDSLIRALRQREDVKSVSFTREKLDDLINLPWVFALLVLFMSLEWFMRKRSGSY